MWRITILEEPFLVLKSIIAIEGCSVSLDQTWFGAALSPEYWVAGTFSDNQANLSHIQASIGILPSYNSIHHRSEGVPQLTQRICAFPKTRDPNCKAMQRDHAYYWKNYLVMRRSTELKCKQWFWLTLNPSNVSKHLIRFEKIEVVNLALHSTYCLLGSHHNCLFLNMTSAVGFGICENSNPNTLGTTPSASIFTSYVSTKCASIPLSSFAAKNLPGLQEKKR